MAHSRAGTGKGCPDATSQAWPVNTAASNKKFLEGRRKSSVVHFPLVRLSEISTKLQHMHTI